MSQLSSSKQQMTQNAKSWYGNKYLSLLRDVLLIVLLMSAISWWLNRGSLAAAGQSAPAFNLSTLTGEITSLKEHQGKQVLLYFFCTLVFCLSLVC